MPNSPADTLTDLRHRIQACNHCDGLALGPRPIFQIGSKAKVLIAGQAPGRITHEKGIPFDDPSGNRLRDWLGVDRETFYDPDKFAIVPMGFCFPGSTKSGDLPPRRECEELWRRPVLDQLKSVELTLVIGKYAMDWHLPTSQGKNLTETVRNWKNYWPQIMPLPHPSPRNGMWLKKNPWFGEEVLPELRGMISALLAD